MCGSHVRGFRLWLVVRRGWSCIGVEDEGHYDCSHSRPGGRQRQRTFAEVVAEPQASPETGVTYRHMTVCEMCERESLRYVHIMTHPEFARPLYCGCECAGHMEDDLEAARSRGARAKALTRRINAAKCRAKNASWHMRPNGQRFADVGRYKLGVLPKGNGFRGACRHIPTSFELHGSRTISTAAEAKTAAIALMIDLMRRQPWEDEDD